MGVAELRKAELYYHKSVQEDIAAALQRSGVCQIIEDAETASGPGAEMANIAEKLRQCEEHETHIRYLFHTLGGYYKDPVSSVDRMLGEKPLLSLAELTKTAQKTDLKGLASSVKKAETALNELRIEVSQLEADTGVLSKIGDFPYTLDVIGEGTRTLKGVLGTLPAERVAELKKELTPCSAETELFVSARDSKAKEIQAVLLYARTHEQQALDCCLRSGMSFIDLPSYLSGTVAEESAKIAARLANCKNREAEIQENLQRMADEWMPVIQKLSDYERILHDRYHALSTSAATDTTVRTCFWIPADALPALQKQVEAISPNTAFAVSAPEKDDHPPVLLRNNAFIRPAEVLTYLYSPPPYGEMEPTPFLAPFFYIFFGMCLGDAGYALVIGAVLWMLFKKYRRMPANVGEFCKLFAICSVTTFIYGAVTGSFFGDFIDAFFFMAPLRPLKQALFVIDPLANPMAILGLSLLLGVIHLMFGLAIAAYDEFRKGNPVDAVGGKVSWILFVVGLIFFGTGAAGAAPELIRLTGLVMAGAGAIIIFLYAGRGTKNILLRVGSGLYALYGGTSYLGDILSYSRLLALGLGSAVIASIINLLSGMAAEIPYVGWLIAIVIVAGGHLFSLAVNVLGAFVHSMRLQYVEFFSKFYAGGGVAFRPLMFSTQYIQVTDSK
ncbi:MAG: V-type ATP synthase subunit I [Synergistaceae bacterium]|jgi:V/A-type H+-transporting ATPase subunit I|nr:V-type ATP synthase subunit I [Synergistaceae bacterium]